MCILSKSFMFLETDFKDRDALFAFAANTLVGSGRATNTDAIVAGLNAREAEFSTYIDFGVAIPHCKISDIKQTTIVFIRNKSLLDWGDDEAANLVFVLAVSDEHANQVHLKILAKLAQSLMDEAFICNIKSTQNIDEIYDILEKINEIEDDKK